MQFSSFTVNRHNYFDFILCFDENAVNKNLVGTGYMSTDQKKKLLWGSKKNTTTVEVLKIILLHCFFWLDVGLQPCLGYSVLYTNK